MEEVSLVLTKRMNLSLPRPIVCPTEVMTHGLGLDSALPSLGIERRLSRHTFKTKVDVSNVNPYTCVRDVSSMQGPLQHSLIKAGNTSVLSFSAVGIRMLTHFYSFNVPRPPCSLPITLGAASDRQEMKSNTHDDRINHGERCTGRYARILMLPVPAEHGLTRA